MSGENMLTELKDNVRSYPDFPKKGIIFRDFFPILQTPRLFEGMLSLFEERLRGVAVQGVVGLESRGFLIGPPLALKLRVPFIPVRKVGKLPGAVRKETYSLEYGSDTLEIQEESISAGEHVVVVDDLLATGGTLEGAVKLVEGVGGVVSQCLVVIELSELDGRKRVKAPLHSLIQF